MEVSINYLAVLVAAIIYMAIAMLYYAPPVLGKIWMELTGMTQAKAAAKDYVFAFISALVLSYVLSHFIALMGGRTVADGVQAGFWAWLGFIVTTHLSAVLWAKKSFKLYLLDMGFYLISFLVIGGLLAVWR